MGEYLWALPGRLWSGVHVRERVFLASRMVLAMRGAIFLGGGFLLLSAGLKATLAGLEVAQPCVLAAGLRPQPLSPRPLLEGLMPVSVACCVPWMMG